MRNIGNQFYVAKMGEIRLIGCAAQVVPGLMSNKSCVPDADEAIGKNRASDLKVAVGKSIERVLSVLCALPVR